MTAQGFFPNAETQRRKGRRVEHRQFEISATSAPLRLCVEKKTFAEVEA